MVALDTTKVERAAESGRAKRFTLAGCDSICEPRRLNAARRPRIKMQSSPRRPSGGGYQLDGIWGETVALLPTAAARSHMRIIGRELQRTRAIWGPPASHLAGRPAAKPTGERAPAGPQDTAGLLAGWLAVSSPLSGRQTVPAEHKEVSAYSLGAATRPPPLGRPQLGRAKKRPNPTRLH